MTGRGKDAQQNGFGGRKRRPSENDDFRKNQNPKQSKRVNDRDVEDEMDPDEEIVKLMAQLMVIVCCVCGERAGQRVFLPCTHVRFCDSCGPDPGRCPECSPTNTTRGNTGNGA